MIEFILGLAGFAARPIRELAQAVAERISLVWSTFTNALTRVRAGFQYWVDRGAIWATGQIRNAVATANRLRYIMFVALPQFLLQAVDVSVRWASDQLSWLLGTLRGEILQVRDWALGKLNDAASVINGIRDWALGQISELRTVARALLDHVFGPLANPTRLVAWILAPLITALLDWFMAHIDDIADAAWRNRRAVEARALAVTESILERIL